MLSLEPRLSIKLNLLFSVIAYHSLELVGERKLNLREVIKYQIAKKMASFSTKEKNKIDNDNPTFLGQLKRIPKEDFLLSLSKGKYLLQSWKIVRLNKTISDHYFPELSLNGRHKQHFSLAEKETEQELLGTIAKLMEGINDRIDQLIGVPGGGDDPLLEEMYQSVDRLLTAGYDHYVQVCGEIYLLYLLRSSS